eukprot:COSAG06_NODE_314_length_17706_cov_366.601940_5_plen_176_part_00
MPQPEGKVLYGAAKAGKLGEVEAAVDAGAPMEWANPDASGKRAVHIASALGHNDVVAFLGSRGADVNAVEDAQATPLHYAATFGQASVCTTLLALGADPAAKSKAGKTALNIARKKNKPECVAVLITAQQKEALAAAKKAAAKQRDIEEKAAADGTAVSGSFIFLPAAFSVLALL